MLLKNLNHFLTFFFGGKHRVNMTEIISVFFCNYNMCNLHTVFSALHFTGVTMYVCVCSGGQKRNEKWKERFHSGCIVLLSVQLEYGQV